MLFAQKIESTAFPERLHALADPPKALYLKGDTSLLRSHRSLAVVGSRRMTEYGKRVLAAFLHPLVAHDITIVSGLAFGIDAEAHRLTLAANGKTIAVLGSGIDLITPQCNERIGEEIIKKGLLVSEYEGSMPGQKYTFPARNRIIAALADAVLVIEGTKHSGSLITADFAMQMGRDVFAIPGPIDAPLSQGPNWLISQGAHCVLTPQDLLTYFSCEQDEQNMPMSCVAMAIANGPQTIDSLVFLCEKSQEDIVSECVSLELKGSIRRTPSGTYISTQKNTHA